MKKLILLGALSVLLCSAPGYTSGHGTGDRNQALGGKEAAAPWERHNVPDQREDAIKEARRIRAAFVAAFAAALGVPAEEAPTPAAQKAEEAEAAKRRDQRVEDCWKEVDAQLALEVLPQKVDKAEGEAPAAAEEEAAAESRQRITECSENLLMWRGNSRIIESFDGRRIITIVSPVK